MDYPVQEYSFLLDFLALIGALAQASLMLKPSANKGRFVAMSAFALFCSGSVSITISALWMLSQHNAYAIMSTPFVPLFISFSLVLAILLSRELVPAIHEGIVVYYLLIFVFVTFGSAYELDRAWYVLLLLFSVFLVGGRKTFGPSGKILLSLLCVFDFLSLYLVQANPHEQINRMIYLRFSEFDALLLGMALMVVAAYLVSSLLSGLLFALILLKVKASFLESYVNAVSNSFSDVQVGWLRTAFMVCLISLCFIVNNHLGVLPKTTLANILLLAAPIIASPTPKTRQKPIDV